MKKQLLFITALLILAGITSLNAQVLPKGSTWKYLDDGSDQGTAWMTVDFDDSGWASGPALLGYGGKRCRGCNGTKFWIRYRKQIHHHILKDHI